jgi:hypothetical protein
MMPMQAGDVNQTWASVERLKTDYNYKPSRIDPIAINIIMDIITDITMVMEIQILK